MNRLLCPLLVLALWLPSSARADVPAAQVTCVPSAQIGTSCTQTGGSQGTCEEPQEACSPADGDAGTNGQCYACLVNSGCSATGSALGPLALALVPLLILRRRRASARSDR